MYLFKPRTLTLGEDSNFVIYHFRSKRIVGVCYVVVKVSLLVVVELGIFPLICGWWLDICSLVIAQI